MRSIALRPWELAAYMREKKLLVVRPVRHQEDIEVDDDGQFIHAHSHQCPGYCDFACDMRCPFGKPGEVLGIKEPYVIGYETGDGQHYSAIPWTGSDPQRDGKVFYRIDCHDDPKGPQRPWETARSMPPWAIRHRPTIADIRVMRVGEIGADDVIATHIDLIGCSTDTAKRNVFASQWMKDHGKDSWASSPWCWFMNVVE
jgi:hypothetical protein